MGIVGELAFDQLGETSPNPTVAALIVKDGEIIGQGIHLGSGKDHAEVMAIESCDTQPEGATLYVSLEPCHHSAKTPPCTLAIKNSGISRVVYGYADPNPNVTGGGAQYLMNEGIDCQHFSTLLIDSMYEAYKQCCLMNRPVLTLKVAMDHLGHIASDDGTPIAITSANMNRLALNWRGFHDALLTTDHTINQDNPRMNIRLGDRIISRDVFILAPNGEVNPKSQIFKTAKKVHLLMDQRAIDGGADRMFLDQGANVYGLHPNTGGFFAWDDILAQIGACGFHSVWLEAGKETSSYLLSNGIPDYCLLLVGHDTHASSKYNLSTTQLMLNAYALKEAYQLGGREFIYFLGRGQWPSYFLLREKLCLQG